MNRILVVVAVDVEARGLARALGLPRVASRRDHHYRGSDIDLVCAGPRATGLARLAPLARSCALVVSAGTCGALAPHLDEGDLVVPATVLGPRGRRHPLAQVARIERRGTLLTVDEVVETAEAKARLWRETAAMAVDMESAIIVEWASALGIPAAVVRGVVDTAATGIPAVLAGVVDGDGRTRVGRALQMVLTRPGSLSAALTLRRSVAVALGRVAVALRALAGPPR